MISTTVFHEAESVQSGFRSKDLGASFGSERLFLVCLFFDDFVVPDEGAGLTPRSNRLLLAWVPSK